MKKKNYVKPQILITSFELSESIASGCELITNANENSCPVIETDTGTQFFTNEFICEFVTPNDDDRVCYHVPSEAYNVFSS